MNKLFAYIKISLAVLTGFCLGSMYYYDSNGQVIEDFIHLGAAYSSGFLFVLMCSYAGHFKIKNILSYSIDYFLYTIVGAAMVLLFLNDENSDKSISMSTEFLEERNRFLRILLFGNFLIFLN